ncbi:MAG: hypothetical protein ACLP01_14655 [Solirubrobacteraceae bacterium]
MLSAGRVSVGDAFRGDFCCHPSPISAALNVVGNRVLKALRAPIDIDKRERPLSARGRTKVLAGAWDLWASLGMAHGPFDDLLATRGADERAAINAAVAAWQEAAANATGFGWSIVTWLTHQLAAAAAAKRRADDSIRKHDVVGPSTQHLLDSTYGTWRAFVAAWGINSPAAPLTPAISLPAQAAPQVEERIKLLVAIWRTNAKRWAHDSTYPPADGVPPSVPRR